MCWAAEEATKGYLYTQLAGGTKDLITLRYKKKDFPAVFEIFACCLAVGCCYGAGFIVASDIICERDIRWTPLQPREARQGHKGDEARDIEYG